MWWGGGVRFRCIGLVKVRATFIRVHSIFGKLNSSDLSSGLRRSRSYRNGEWGRSETQIDSEFRTNWKFGCSVGEEIDAHSLMTPAFHSNGANEKEQTLSNAYELDGFEPRKKSIRILAIAPIVAVIITKRNALPSQNVRWKTQRFRLISETIKMIFLVLIWFSHDAFSGKSPFAAVSDLNYLKFGLLHQQ